MRDVVLGDRDARKTRDAAHRLMVDRHDVAFKKNGADGCSAYSTGRFCAAMRVEATLEGRLQGQVIIESGLVLTGITITRVCFQRR